MVNQDLFLQGVTFGFQIAESGADKNTESAGRLRHINLPEVEKTENTLRPVINKVTVHFYLIENLKQVVNVMCLDNFIRRVEV